MGKKGGVDVFVVGIGSSKQETVGEEAMVVVQGKERMAEFNDT